MKNSPWTYLLLLALLALGPAVRAQEPSKIVIEPLHPGPESEFVHDENGWSSVGTNGVVIKDASTVLTANKISYNESSGQAVAEGNVSLQNEGRLWRSERLEYNFKTRELKADTFKVGLPPYFAIGEGLTGSQTNQTYTATQAFLTTDDVADPSYKIRASRLKLIPGKLIEAEPAAVYAGGAPILYLPYFHRNLESHPNNFVFTPGYRSLYGPYLLGTYNWFWSTNLDGALNLDYRQKRGVAGGPDFNYDLGFLGRGSLSGYFLRDVEPGKDPEGNPIRENRHRVSFSHQATIRSNLTATVVVREQSDAQIIRDFFESRYRENPQPKSFLEINQLWPNFGLNVLAQPQINDFFQTVERLPDVKFSAFRQQLGVSPLYYESESSVAYLRFQPAEGSATNAFAALRADSFHQLLLPRTFFGWLNVTPRVGGRFTHYGETDGQGASLAEQNRGVFNTGTEVSFKASRVSAGARSRFWEVNGLRHILEPSFNYVFVPSPTRSPRELPQFDSEIPNLRLPPIDFPDFNSIDSIDSQNVLRLGLRNKIQTKRRENVENLLDWALFTDWRLDPRSDQGRFSDAISDFDFKPRSWLTLSSEVRYDVENERFRMANHTATIEPNDTWSVSLGHRYFREDPAFGLLSGNNLIHSSLFYRLNENWAARMTHHFEARDGVLEEQYYTLYRDLRSATAALTLRIRDQRNGPQDITVAITFSLKAFPRYGLGKDKDKHTLLLGG